MNKLRIGIIAVLLLLICSIATLRITGLEPEYMDYTTEAYNQRGRMTYPGLWLKESLYESLSIIGIGFRMLSTL